MNKQIMIAVILIMAISSSIGLLSGCATPSPTPAPVNTPAPETSIPANYSTYTEEGLFSISYPSSWEIVTSIMKELEPEMNEELRSIAPEINWEEVSMVFYAGLPYDGGYMPNVNINIEPLPKAYTLDEYAEASVRGLKAITTSYYEVSRTKKHIGGREAFILECEATFEGVPTVHILVMGVPDGKVGWSMGCGTLPEVYSEYEADLHSIINSFRLLK